MDSQRFDDLTRSLSSESTRRTLLRGLLGGAAALVGLHATASAAPRGKVDVCHYDADSGTYHRINVNENALQAHLNHGDNSNVGCASGYALNTDTCVCERDFSAYACDKFNDWAPTCGSNDRGFCVINVDTEGLVCVGSVMSPDCNSCEGGCADGWVCVSHDGCEGVNHCHPLFA